MNIESTTPAPVLSTTTSATTTITATTAASTTTTTIKRHSALKLEKNAISKVQKKHYLHFQKWQKINFCTRKKFKTTKNPVFFSPKIAFLVVLNFFLIQKLIFGHF